jgi:hypothetical protein
MGDARSPLGVVRTHPVQFGRTGMREKRGAITTPSVRLLWPVCTLRWQGDTHGCAARPASRTCCCKRSSGSGHRRLASPAACPAKSALHRQRLVGAVVGRRYRPCMLCWKRGTHGSAAPRWSHTACCKQRSGSGRHPLAVPSACLATSALHRERGGAAAVGLLGEAVARASAVASRRQRQNGAVVGGASVARTMRRIGEMRWLDPGVRHRRRQRQRQRQAVRSRARQ